MEELLWKVTVAGIKSEIDDVGETLVRYHYHPFTDLLLFRPTNVRCDYTISFQPTSTSSYPVVETVLNIKTEATEVSQC